MLYSLVNPTQLNQLTAQHNSEIQSDSSAILWIKELIPVRQVQENKVDHCSLFELREQRLEEIFHISNLSGNEDLLEYAMFRFRNVRLLPGLHPCSIAHNRNEAIYCKERTGKTNQR